MGQRRRLLKAPALFIIFIIFILTVATLFFDGAAATASKGVTRSQAKSEINRFMKKKHRLVYMGTLRLPGVSVYEIRSRDKKLYFQVNKRTGEVVYASLGEINFRAASAAAIPRGQASKIAAAFAARHSALFKNLRLSPDQADYYWPKPTYWTFIWKAERRSRYDFAKVTIDGQTKKVVSFGVGNRNWSMFCLPDKKQAKWATSL